MVTRTARAVCLVLAISGTVLIPAGTALAISFPEFVDPNPSAGNQFGYDVVALSTGNVVIVAPYDNGGAAAAGAVYLFNGSTGGLISVLRGSTAGDQIGKGGVQELANGNYVIRSPAWHNGAVAGAGAVTWGNGMTGVSGFVSPTNSLVGSTAGDGLGATAIRALSNGNYVIISSSWDNGGVVDAGAVTWGNGTTGVTGTISVANSLLGSSANDLIGNGGVWALPNGNYVVGSPNWNGGAGAATWGSGTTGVVGVVSAANSLVGSTAGDQVGYLAKALANGNYVVMSNTWHNGATANAGSVTWGNGATGVTGAVSAANSLVGIATGDHVGQDVTTLTNGNYVVLSPFWNNGATAGAGAATWANGSTGLSGTVSGANSLVGTQTNDQVGTNVAALSNGNYVVQSPTWDNGAVADAGAATWGNGTTGVTGAVSAANSLVGSSAIDKVSAGGVTALTNGNYVVLSSIWHNGGVTQAGAATWGNGATGITGAVSAANSLVGSSVHDEVGVGGAIALSNGNYVVGSANWNNGAVGYAGAATWGNGTTGTTGVVSTVNSLVGSTAYDEVGLLLDALPNGNYVVRSLYWSNGAKADAGAVTWGSGTAGVTGAVSAANSLVGSQANDDAGLNGIVVLANGNYVVLSPYWDNGPTVDAGAATWGDGATGVSGLIDSGNSLVGSTYGDRVGSNVTALSNGNYVVLSTFWDWDIGALTDAGAGTWGDGTSGVTGAITSGNSILGHAATSSLNFKAVDDSVNGTFMCRFLTEGGGHVRVGPLDAPATILSAVDIPADQGGWLRMTFTRSTLDKAGLSPLVTMYGVMRHVPGTTPARAGEARTKFIGSVPGSQLSAIPLDAPSGTWELVATVPALQALQYVVAVPTVSNAAPNDFLVTTHTTDPLVWFVSNVVSGQSIDNLAPAPPAPFTAAYADGATHLHWGPNSEPDLGGYKLYRGSSAGFVPGPANLVTSQPDTGFADVGPAGSYYKLSAVDVNGNESTFALVSPEQTLGVGDGGGPVAFALEGVRPNPASGHNLRISFALPLEAPAQLELLDVSGRRLLVRDVGMLGPGRHIVNLAEGRTVTTGIYWVRLTQGRNRRTTRAAVID